MLALLCIKLNLLKVTSKIITQLQTDSNMNFMKKKILARATALKFRSNGVTTRTWIKASINTL